jgi:peptidoglycan/LPS O-acetylase OafA/YrhL
MSRQFEYPVEGLRGIAALMVLYCHLLAPEIALDPGYVPSGLFWTIETGHAAVLFFFVLSGYVIGLTNAADGWSKGAARNYLWRRFVRLYPMYFLAVVLGYAVRPVESWPDLLGNLLLLQNAAPYGSVEIPLLAGNTNLWSLNYELLYYLLFLVLWARPRLIGAALAISVVLVVWFRLGGSVPQFLMSYAAGWIFWMAGLCLAWYAPSARDAREERAPWLSYLLLFIATAKLLPAFYIAQRFLGEGAEEGWVGFYKLDFVPICLACLAAAAGRRAAWVTAVRWIAVGWPAVYVLWRIARGHFLQNEGLIIPELMVVVAVGLLWWRTSNAVLVKMAWIGGISYGIYIFQRPVQWLLLDHVGWLTGTWWTFALRFVMAVALTFVVAWVVEKRLQPLVRQWLGGKRREARG